MTVKLQEHAAARLREEMRKRDVDAYVCTGDASLRYLLDYKVSDALPDAKIAGLLVAILPADESAEMIVVSNDFRAGRIEAHLVHGEVRSYRSWVEIRSLAELKAERAEKQTRPVQWSADDRDALVAAALSDAGVTTGRIAIDARLNPEELSRRLRALCPQAEFVDSHELVYAARRVKCAEEVGRIRDAVRLSEAGMNAILASWDHGMSIHDIERIFKAGAHAEAAKTSVTLDGAWILSDHFVNRAEGWATLKLDAGVLAEGYNCDGGRSFTLGGCSAEFAEVYRLLQTAHARAIDAIRPGVPMAKVFADTEKYIQAHGLPGFSRGHFGHSVGVDPFPEEPPFIAAGEVARFEEGMVLAVEVPFYGSDIGSIQIEDTVVVTRDGCEILHTMSHDLLDVRDFQA